MRHYTSNLISKKNIGIEFHIYLPCKYRVFTIKTCNVYSTYIDLVLTSIPVPIPVLPGYRCTVKGLMVGTTGTLVDTHRQMHAQTHAHTDSSIWK